MCSFAAFLIKSVRVLCVAVCTVVIYFHCSIVHFKIISQLILLLKELEVVCHFGYYKQCDSNYKALYQYLNPGACIYIGYILYLITGSR